MALGRRKSNRQQDLFISHQDLPTSPGHPFYKALNRLLTEIDLDEQLEILCAPYYRQGGRPSIPPGVYFRMLFVGFFENIDSQRGIAWRCSDSLSLRDFLGLSMSESVPDHSSLTRWRQRLPLEVHEEVFRMVLSLADQKKLVSGKSVGVDSTTLEANAAMKSIVRKKGKEAYKKYLRRLAEQSGIEDPSDEDLRRFDRNRPGKTSSNAEWESPTDPDSRILRMKDGRTRMGYKAEHVVDLENDIVVGAEIYHGDEMDVSTLTETVDRARSNLYIAGAGTKMKDVVADKGYYSTSNLCDLADCGLQPVIADPHQKRRWSKRRADERAAVYGNRRRNRSRRGRALQRLRSEYTERSFAHICNQGGARRTWIRGRDEVAKRYLLQVAARNLSVIMRRIFGIGTPKEVRRGKNPILASLLASCHGIIMILIRPTMVVVRKRAAEVRVAG